MSAAPAGRSVGASGIGSSPGDSVDRSGGASSFRLSSAVVVLSSFSGRSPSAGVSSSFASLSPSALGAFLPPPFFFCFWICATWRSSQSVSQPPLPRTGLHWYTLFLAAASFSALARSSSSSMLSSIAVGIMGGCGLRPGMTVERTAFRFEKSAHEPGQGRESSLRLSKSYTPTGKQPDWPMLPHSY